MQTLFIVNPRSGSRKKTGIEAVVRESCASWVETEVAVTTSKEELDELLDRARGSGCRYVFAVGGDGTISEVARRLIGSGMALGIIPTGSGNGLARHLGLPMNPGRAIASCSSLQTTLIDTAEVNGEPFIGVLGIGFDASVAHRFAETPGRGLKNYIICSIEVFRSFQPFEVSIDVDGTRTDTRAMIVAVANSSQYGNEAKIAPLASLQDGLLDVVILAPQSIFVAPVILAGLFTGQLHRHRGTTLLRGRKITITRAGPGPAHIDGEPINIAARLDVTVRERSLKVVMADCAPASI